MDTIARLAADPASWAALATLIAMEVVLGVDNLVFIALLSNRVEASRRTLARSLGLVSRAHIPPCDAGLRRGDRAPHRTGNDRAGASLFCARPAAAGGRVISGVEGDD